MGGVPPTSLEHPMLLRRDNKTKDKVEGAGQAMLNFQPREEVQVKSIKACRDPTAGAPDFCTEEMGMSPVLLISCTFSST